MTNSYLKEAIETLVSEVLGKFNLAYFKRLAAEHVREPDETWEDDDGNERRFSAHDLKSSKSPSEYFPEVHYAEQMLPLIGDGSSRITFALSGGKVLKIAKGEAGIAQNQEEVSFFEKSGRNDIFTKVYESDKDFKWIIAELVKPLDTQNVGQTLTDLVGMSSDTFINMANLLKHREVVSAVQQLIKNLNQLLSHYNEMPEGLLKEKESLENILNDPSKLKLFDDLKKAIQSGFHIGDLWDANIGRTVDGKIKILDYGFSRDIGQKYY